jgi:O-methyltransferase
MSTATLEALAPAALSYKWTLADSYRCAKQLIEERIEGDFVECGVYAGAQCAAMAKAIIEEPEWDGRRIHLFDSFSGIPAAGPEDLEYLKAGHMAGLSACSLEQVKANMAAWGIPSKMLVYHPGMFEGTVPRSIRIGTVGPKIALLRLDGDLYRSTKVCIENLYPLLSQGGICIADDYALSGCRLAVDEFMQGNFSPIYWRKP